MGLKNILDMLQFKDEYDDEYEEDDYDTIRVQRSTDFSDDKFDSEDVKSSSSEEQKASSESSTTSSNINTAKKVETEQRKVRPVKMERANNSKVVPIKSAISKSLAVSIMKPTCFEDAQDICDMLLEGKATVVNLEGFDPIEAQRIMDFIYGCIYAMDGRFHPISKYIFIFSPDNVDISGDYLDLLPSEGFSAPVINKDF